MTARDFTKAEKVLFYTNIGLVVFGIIYSCLGVSYFDPSGAVKASIQQSAGNSFISLAFTGVFFTLLSGQFCKGWNVVYLILQILLILNVLSLVFLFIGLSVLTNGYLSVYQQGKVPEDFEFMKNTTVSMVNFMTRNIDFQDYYASAEKYIHFCGLYSLSDAVGKECIYSNKDVCAEADIKPLVYLLLNLTSTALTAGYVNFLIMTVVELAVMVVIIIAIKSASKVTEEKKPLVEMAPSSNPTYIMSPPVPSGNNVVQAASYSNQPSTFPVVYSQNAREQPK